MGLAAAARAGAGRGGAGRGRSGLRCACAEGGRPGRFWPRGARAASRAYRRCATRAARSSACAAASCGAPTAMCSSDASLNSGPSSAAYASMRHTADSWAGGSFTRPDLSTTRCVPSRMAAVGQGWGQQCYKRWLQLPQGKQQQAQPADISTISAPARPQLFPGKRGRLQATPAALPAPQLSSGSLASSQAASPCMRAAHSSLYSCSSRRFSFSRLRTWSASVRAASRSRLRQKTRALAAQSGTNPVVPAAAEAVAATAAAMGSSAAQPCNPRPCKPPAPSSGCNALPHSPLRKQNLQPQLQRTSSPGSEPSPPPGPCAACGCRPALRASPGHRRAHPRWRRPRRRRRCWPGAAPPSCGPRAAHTTAAG